MTGACICALQPPTPLARHYLPHSQTVPSRTPATNAAGEDFFSSLPRPGGASGLSSLPPPSSSSLGGGGAEGRTAGGKKVIMLPLQRQLLAAAALDSDDEEEPAAKRFKAGAGGKSKLMDFLPPPKNDTGPITGTLGGGLSRSSKASGAGAGAAGAFGSAGPGPSSAAAAADAVSGAGSGGASAALPSDFFAGNEAAAYSNEAFRVAENEGPAPYGGYDPSGAGGGYSGYGHHHNDPAHAAAAAAAAAAYYSAQQQDVYGPGPGAARSKHAASALAAGVDEGASADLLEEALKAEQERAAKRGGGGKAGMFGPGVKVVEVKAKDLTAMDPAAREAAKTAQDALGSEYASELAQADGVWLGSGLCACVYGQAGVVWEGKCVLFRGSGGGCGGCGKACVGARAGLWSVGTGGASGCRHAVVELTRVLLPCLLATAVQWRCGARRLPSRATSWQSASTRSAHCSSTPACRWAGAGGCVCVW